MKTTRETYAIVYNIDTNNTIIKIPVPCDIEVKDGLILITKYQTRELMFIGPINKFYVVR